MERSRNILWSLSHRVLVHLEKNFPAKGLWFGLRFRMECKRRHGPFQQYFIEKVYEGADIQTLGGPFTGLRYCDGTYFGPITPRWLGSYEEALHPIVQDVISQTYGTIIDVGSAEGYYAIGFARALPESEVFSFDTDPVSRSQQKKLIELNRVTNLHLSSFCYHEFLKTKRFNGRVFLLVDIEGWEYELLDPTRCAALAEMDILTEVHEGFGLSYEEMIECLVERFANTHDVERITDSPRKPSDYSELVGNRLSVVELQEAANEYRPWQNSWLMFRSRSRAIG